MTDLFYSTTISRKLSSTGVGWATRTARFEYAPIWANIMLSYYDHPNGERFEPFQPRYARAWIETPQTPTMSVGAITVPMANPFKDSTVFLTTDRLTFQLQTDGVTAVAVGMIFDRRPDGARLGRNFTAAPLWTTLDLAIHDEEGNVVGTHQEVQLEGGRPIDIEAVQNEVLMRAQTVADTRLRAAIVDLTQIPDETAFRIDPSSGRAFPLESNQAG